MIRRGESRAPGRIDHYLSEEDIDDEMPREEKVSAAPIVHQDPEEVIGNLLHKNATATAGIQDAFAAAINSKGSSRTPQQIKQLLRDNLFPPDSSRAPQIGQTIVLSQVYGGILYNILYRIEKIKISSSTKPDRNDGYVYGLIPVRQPPTFVEECHHALIMSSDNIKSIKKDILKNAKRSNTPILIKHLIKQKNQFFIYGDKNGKGEWDFTEIEDAAKIPKKLLFHNTPRILKLFSGSLIDTLKTGHIFVKKLKDGYNHPSAGYGTCAHLLLMGKSNARAAEYIEKWITKGEHSRIVITASREWQQVANTLQIRLDLDVDFLPFDSIDDAKKEEKAIVPSHAADTVPDVERRTFPFNIFHKIRQAFSRLANGIAQLSWVNRIRIALFNPPSPAPSTSPATYSGSSPLGKHPTLPIPIAQKEKEEKKKQKGDAYSPSSSYATSYGDLLSPSSATTVSRSDSSPLPVGSYSSPSGRKIYPLGRTTASQHLQSPLLAAPPAPLQSGSVRHHQKGGTPRKK